MRFGRFGRIFEDIEREFEETERMIEEMFRTARRLGPETGPLYYGYSIQIGPDGIPHIEHFGNVTPVSGGILETGVREPYTTTVVDDKHNELKINAEMPGVTKDQIKITATEDQVEITAEGEDRKYRKVLKTPVPVDPETSKASYNNGVLELTLKLKEPVKKGKEIKVD